MHLICIICIKKDFSNCIVCFKRSEFSILTTKLRGELIANPCVNFNKPMEISMFQLSSAVNLIIHLKDENRKYRELLLRMKEQLQLLKEEKNAGLNHYNNEYKDLNRGHGDKNGNYFPQVSRRNKEERNRNFKKKDVICHEYIQSSRIDGNKHSVQQIDRNNTAKSAIPEDIYRYRKLETVKNMQGDNINRRKTMNMNAFSNRNSTPIRNYHNKRTNHEYNDNGPNERDLNNKRINELNNIVKNSEIRKYGNCAENKSVGFHAELRKSLTKKVSRANSSIGSYSVSRISIPIKKYRNKKE